MMNENKMEMSFSIILIDVLGIEVWIFKLLFLLYCFEYIYYYNESVLECLFNMLIWIVNCVFLFFNFRFIVIFGFVLRG